MTVLTASGRVWHRNWLVYRRLWHRSLAFGFLQPVLFLTAMGVGHRRAPDAGRPERVRRLRLHHLARPGPAGGDGDADGDLRVDLPDHEQDHVGPELRGDALDAAPDPQHRVGRAGVVGLPDRHPGGRLPRRARSLRHPAVAARGARDPVHDPHRPRVQLVPDRVHGHPEERRRLQRGLPLRHQPALPLQRHVLPAHPAARAACRSSRG